MIHPFHLVLAASVLILAGCGGDPSEDTGPKSRGAGSEAPFIVMDESLDRLKQDFNEAAGSVRLLFLSGPTCGICLRGLNDLNTELLGGNTDPRLQTLVVHQPTLDANETDARNSTVLIDNPHTRHYWEDTGVIGRLYQDVMDIDFYAWDMWFIYGPQARWEGKNPPKPDYWMHQLGPLPGDKYLDAEVFAARANEMLADLPPADSEPVRMVGHGQSPVAVETVAQPAAVALRQHITARGRYRNLAAIESLRMEGTITTSSGLVPIVITADRDGTLTRTIGKRDSASAAVRENGELNAPPANAERGLPWSLEREIMDAFELNGPLVAWKDKGHRLESTVNMMRLDDVLAWELDLTQHNGRRWLIFIDSHDGMELRRVLLDGNEQPLLDMRFDDFRVAEPDTPYPSRFDQRRERSNRGFYATPGYVFPFRVDYRGPDGRLIATERLVFIDVDFTAGSE